jgi:hypothetical protein
LLQKKINTAFHEALKERSQFEEQNILPKPPKDPTRVRILNESIEIIDNENMEYIKRKRKKTTEDDSIKKKKRNKARLKSEKKI